jgi:predicted protein tyrosine phosphatase
VRLLFLCGRNRQRSPTAEQIFGNLPDVQVISAGLNAEADSQVDADMLEWADLVLVMEESHRRRLTQMFDRQLAAKRVVCLGIADDYAFMDRVLIDLLWQRVGRHVPAICSSES